MLADELTRASTERCRLHSACDEVGRRIDRTARVVGGPVRGDIFPVGLADRVTAVAQIDRLRTPDRGDGQWGAEFGARIAEGDDRRDEVRRVGRERVVETQDRHGYRGDDVYDSRALRVAAEHEPGIGAGTHHVLNVGACVVRPIAGEEKVIRRWIVHEVGADGAATDLAAQRLYERPADG